MTISAVNFFSFLMIMRYAKYQILKMFTGQLNQNSFLTKTKSDLIDFFFIGCSLLLIYYYLYRTHCFFF